MGGRSPGQLRTARRSNEQLTGRRDEQKPYLRGFFIYWIYGRIIAEEPACKGSIGVYQASDLVHSRTGQAASQ